MKFTNSDPAAIKLFLARLHLLGVERERLRFSLAIHESADVATAEQFWTGTTRADASQLDKTSLKRHNPKATRKTPARHTAASRPYV